MLTRHSWRGEASAQAAGPHVPRASQIMDGYKLALLRDGAGEQQRALWSFYGSLLAHGHNDALTIGLFAKVSTCCQPSAITSVEGHRRLGIAHPHATRLRGPGQPGRNGGARARLRADAFVAVAAA